MLSLLYSPHSLLINQFHLDHNASGQYLHLKFCIIIASSFFGVLQLSKEKSKTLVRYILEISLLLFRDVFSDGGGEVKRNNPVFSIPGLKPVKK